MNLPLSFLGRIKNFFKRFFFFHSLLCFSFQCISAPIALSLSLWFILGNAVFDVNIRFLLEQASGLMIISAGVLLCLKPYKRKTKHFHILVFFQEMKTVLFTILFFIPYLLFTSAWDHLPAMAIPLLSLLLSYFFVSSRLIADHFVQKFFSPLVKKKTTNTILIGYNSDAEIFLQENLINALFCYNIQGFIKDNPSKPLPCPPFSLKCLGDLTQLKTIIQQLEVHVQKPDLFLITNRSLGKKELQFLLEYAAIKEIKISLLPCADHYLSNRHTPYPQPLPLNFLLKSSMIRGKEFTFKLIKFFKGKRILITGAGGSIAQELLKEIGNAAPAHIILLDYHEKSLLDIHYYFQNYFPHLSHRMIVLNITQKERIFSLFLQEKPDVVFHCATLKNQPPLEERFFEGIEIDFLGTAHIAEACISHEVEYMFFLSHHSASCISQSIGGITKRMAEAYCQSLDLNNVPNKKIPYKTRIIPIRFGHVLEADNSVCLFQQQIKTGGPVTIAHPKQEKYFISSSIATQLILQSCISQEITEKARGQVVTLHPGEKISLLHLAENIILLSGLRPHIDIKIAFEEPRIGLKTSLNQDFFKNNDSRIKTEFPQIFIEITPQIPYVQIAEFLEKIKQEICAQNKDSCINTIYKVLPYLLGQSNHSLHEGIYKKR